MNYIENRKVGVWLDYIEQFIREQDSTSALKYIEKLQEELRGRVEFSTY